MREASISVVMPVYNAAAFLERSLASLEAQTFRDWELLAADDASTDASYELLVRHAAQDERIRPLRLPENRGCSAARNEALARSRGEWIAYLDADDEYYPNYLGQVYAQRHLAEVLLSPYDIINEFPGSPSFGSVRIHDPSQFKGRLARKDQNIASPLGVAHRRALLDRSGLFNESLHYEVDWHLWKRFVDAGASFAYSSERSGLYHGRCDSISSFNRSIAGARNLKRQGKRSEARLLALEILRMNFPARTRLETREFLQTLAMEDKDFEAALRYADEMISEFPERARLHNNRGIVLANAGKLSEAILAFTRALELRADYPVAAANLARARHHHAIQTKPNG